MADFFIRPVLSENFAATEWTETATENRPSRITSAGIPHIYWVALIGQTLKLQAIPNGSDVIKPDGQLGGRLFTAWIAEHPGERIITDSISILSQPVAGFSAAIRLLPKKAGPHRIVVRRPSGGAVGLTIWAVSVMP